jgi:hypothetical protein
MCDKLYKEKHFYIIYKGVRETSISPRSFILVDPPQDGCIPTKIINDQQDEELQTLRVN